MAPTPQDNLDCPHTDGAIDSAPSMVRRSLLPISHVLKRALPADPAQYHPGGGIKPPQQFNNKGYFALFAILGAAMVIASIWFFFWAKNGGFVWHKTDWDDYKSTVLRRKDKYGNTLTNCTPPTNLGEKSIAGTWDNDRDSRGDLEAQDVKTQDFANARRTNNGKRSRPQGHRREPSDDDLRAYRKERSAKVGGLNRQEDGSHYDEYSNGSRSDLVSEHSTKPLRPSPLKQEESNPKKGFMKKQREKVAEKKAQKAQKKEEKKHKKDAKKDDPRKNNAPSRPRHTFAADEQSMPDMSQYRTQDATAYLNAYRPPAPPHAASRRNEHRQSSRQYPQHQSASNSRQHSPTKPAGARTHPRHPGSFDAYSDAGTSDTGTKSYAHHIPQLARGSRDTGFKRGMGGGRRDSLSDSDEDDMAGFRRR